MGTLATGKPLPLSWKDRLKDPTTMIAAGAGAGLILIIGILLMLVMKKGKKEAAGAQGKVITKADLAKAVEEAKATAALESATAVEQMQAALTGRKEEQHNADLAALASLKLPTVTTKKADVLTKEIRESTKKDSITSANVLQTWLHDQ